MNLSSVWIGVVLGIVGSLLAAYLKPWIDTFGGRVSQKWGQRTTARAAARRAIVEGLRVNQHDQLMMGYEALAQSLRGLCGLIIGVTAIGAGILVRSVPGRSIFHLTGFFPFGGRSEFLAGMLIHAVGLIVGLSGITLLLFNDKASVLAESRKEPPRV